MLSAKVINFLLFFPGFLFSLAFHESAHGLVANRLGDPTAKRLGRVTLNPFPHMDPVGTLLLPIFGYFMGGFIIGWGIPVPVDYRNLKNWKRDGFYVAIAGPISNLILALILAGIIHGVALAKPGWLNPDLNFNGFTILGALVQVFYLNLALAFFNLVPIHPLDGGKVLYGILPQPYANRFDAFAGRYGFMILLLLFFTGAFRILVWYPVQFVAGLLL
ncbi:MAG: site-2 protease family protein [Deltaproteobacteria bacterium]|nr:site-2 protease family protein [Deltaproteobacteria bacterium]